MFISCYSGSLVHSSRQLLKEVESENKKGIRGKSREIKHPWLPKKEKKEKVFCSCVQF